MSDVALALSAIVLTKAWRRTIKTIAQPSDFACGYDELRSCFVNARLLWRAVFAYYFFLFKMTFKELAMSDVVRKHSATRSLAVPAEALAKAGVPEGN